LIVKSATIRWIREHEKTLNEIASEYRIYPNMARQWRDKALASLSGEFSRKGHEEQAAEAAAHEKRECAEFHILSPRS
jgi:transposase-like protein